MPTPPKQPLPKVVRFYIRQTLIGYALAAIFVAALLFLDVARLGSLIATSDVGAMAVLLLWFFHGIVFSGAQFGIALWLDAETEDPGPKGPSVPALVPQRSSSSVARR